MTFSEYLRIAWGCVLIACVIGWVMNLYAVVMWITANPAFSSVSALDIGRIVGVFITPLGAALGYF